MTDQSVKNYLDIIDNETIPYLVNYMVEVSNNILKEIQVYPIAKFENYKNTLSRNVKNVGIPDIEDEELKFDLIQEAFDDLSWKINKLASVELYASGRMNGHWHIGRANTKDVRKVISTLFDVSSTQLLEDWSREYESGPLDGNDFYMDILLEEDLKKLFSLKPTEEFIEIIKFWDEYIKELEEVSTEGSLKESIKKSNKIKEDFDYPKAPGVSDKKAEYNFSGDEGKPSGDGVCDGHNKAGMSGSDPCTNQSGQDYDSNPKLFESYLDQLCEEFTRRDYEADTSGSDDGPFDEIWEQADAEPCHPGTNKPAVKGTPHFDYDRASNGNNKPSCPVKNDTYEVRYGGSLNESGERYKVFYTTKSGNRIGKICTSKKAAESLVTSLKEDGYKDVILKKGTKTEQGDKKIKENSLLNDVLNGLRESENKKTLRESYTFTSENGDKSFDQLYKDQDYLFEDVDSMIDPRMKQLFESEYPNHATRKRLKEDAKKKKNSFLLDVYAIRLQEKKDHLIDKANLTPEQKAEIKAFFTKHPNYESKIDWNNLGRLTYKDFEPIMKEAEGAKSAIKNKAGTREGIASEFNLAPKESYEILKVEDGKIFVTPLSHEGAMFMQTAYNINSHWCIATSNIRYWKEYIKEGTVFILFYDHDSKEKLMIQAEPLSSSGKKIHKYFKLRFWNPKDECIADINFAKISPEGIEFLERHKINPTEIAQLVCKVVGLYDEREVRISQDAERLLGEDGYKIFINYTIRNVYENVDRGIHTEDVFPTVKQLLTDDIDEHSKTFKKLNTLFKGFEKGMKGLTFEVGGKVYTNPLYYFQEYLLQGGYIASSNADYLKSILFEGIHRKLTYRLRDAWESFSEFVEKFENSKNISESLFQKCYKIRLKEGHKPMNRLFEEV